MLLSSILGEDFFDDLFEWPRAYSPSAAVTAFPPLNIHEDEDNYYVTAEIPGVAKEDVKVRLKENMLTLEGKRSTEEKEGRRYFRRERACGKFKRSISLGETVDTNKIRAEYKHGVLLITLGKSEESKSREIKIN